MPTRPLSGVNAASTVIARMHEPLMTRRLATVPVGPNLRESSPFGQVVDADDARAGRRERFDDEAMHSGELVRVVGPCTV